MMSKAVGRGKFEEFRSYTAKGIVLGGARKRGMQVPIILEILKGRRLGKSQEGPQTAKPSTISLLFLGLFFLSLPFLPPSHPFLLSLLLSPPTKSI